MLKKTFGSQHVRLYFSTQSRKKKAFYQSIDGLKKGQCCVLYFCTLFQKKKTFTNPLMD